MGTRVRCLDEGCGALMHGHEQPGELKYICSRYEGSDGRECQHNTVSSERLFEFACHLVSHGLRLAGGEEVLRGKLREHALRLRTGTSDTVRRDQAEFWEAKVASLTADAETAGRRMAVERDDATYEMLKREYARLAGEVAKAKGELAAATAALSLGEEISVDQEVEAAVRVARHLAAALQDPANREEACEVFRRLGIQIGLTFGAERFGPKRMVRRLKGGVVVYGDAELPKAVTLAPDAAAGELTGPKGGTNAANPFAKALLAAMDPNAPKGGRKSLDRRQTVDSTTTAPSGKPGRISASGLTKATSFGQESSGGRT